jgi:hypothetical protein
MRLGIGDSSSNDTFPTTDWLKAASMGVKFAIIRATTTGAWDYTKGKPTLIEDARFKDNFAGAVAAGIEVWPYIWFDPRPQLSGEEQAAFFMAVMQKYTITQRWIFDTEPYGSIVYDANSLLRLQRAMNLAKKVCLPANYSYPAFLEKMVTIADISWMREFPFIVAHWDVPAPRIPFPYYPGGQLGWQTTASMRGDRYGLNAKDKFSYPPQICMAVME